MGPFRRYRETADSGVRRALYFCLLSLATGMADPTGLVSLPLLFVLKDQLSFGAPAVALFDTIILIPHYAAFLFGMLRDRWRPLGMGDRGYLLLAAPLLGTAYLWISASPVTYGRLLVGMLLAMVAAQFIETAAQSLMTAVGQQIQMTGRLSALIETTAAATGAVAMLGGGWLAANADVSTTFLVGAAMAGAVALFGIWNPSWVFWVPDETPDPTPADWRYAGRLIRDPAFGSACAIFLLYSFSPGWRTPLLYYLTDDLGLSGEAFGASRAVTFAATAVATGVYGYLCVRHPLKRLLWWSVVLNVFIGFLFLLIETSVQAIVVSTGIGFLVGFANIALSDLLMRSSPRGHEGAATMLAASVFAVAGASSDLLGAWLYEQGGFLLCLVIDSVATLFILPLLWRLPRRVADTLEGEDSSA